MQYTLVAASVLFASSSLAAPLKVAGLDLTLVEGAIKPVSNLTGALLKRVPKPLGIAGINLPDAGGALAPVKGLIPAGIVPTVPELPAMPAVPAVPALPAGLKREALGVAGLNVPAVDLSALKPVTDMLGEVAKREALGIAGIDLSVVTSAAKPVTDMVGSTGLITREALLGSTIAPGTKIDAAMAVAEGAIHGATAGIDAGNEVDSSMVDAGSVASEVLGKRLLGSAVKPGASIDGAMSTAQGSVTGATAGIDAGEEVDSSMAEADSIATELLGKRLLGGSIKPGASLNGAMSKAEESIAGATAGIDTGSEVDSSMTEADSVATEVLSKRLLGGTIKPGSSINGAMSTAEGSIAGATAGIDAGKMVDSSITNSTSVVTKMLGRRLLGGSLKPGAMIDSTMSTAKGSVSGATAGIDAGQEVDGSMSNTAAILGNVVA